jgi:hypothetical protein
MPAISRVFPVSQSVSWDRIGAIPNVSTLSVSINESEEVLYQQYYIQFENTSVNWLRGPDQNGSYVDGFVELDLQNLDSLPAGTYKATVYVELSNADHFIRTLTSVVNLTLTGSAQVNIQTEKPTYQVYFNRANNTLSGDTTVNIVNNVESKVLSFFQPNTVFEPRSVFTDNFVIGDNAALSIANNPSLPASGTILYQCKLLGPSSEFVAGFEIELVLLNDNGIGVSPDSLSFEVIKNTTEKNQTVSIINPLGIAFTIETPNWLIPSANSGNTSSSIVVTTSTDNLVPGTFNEFFTVKFVGGQIDVPVKLVLKQFITLQDSDFCLDLKPILFSKITPTAAYVKITISATYSVLGVETLVNQAYKIPYINDKATFDLGTKLHNYFPRIKQHLFDEDSTEVLKAIKCDLTIEELDVDYATVLSEDVDDLKFFPGKKPKMFPILTNFEHRKRNKSSEMFFTHVSGDSVITEKISDDLDEVVFGGETITLYRFPDAFSPIQMQWENQNLVPEWFSFTGDYNINAEFNHITSKNILNSLMGKFATTKIKKLTINTGFMMQSEIELLEEIVESRLMFLKIDNKIFECYSTTSKLALDSSSQSIIERDLEFIIVEK